MKSKLSHKKFSGKIYWITPNFYSLNIGTECNAYTAEIPNAIKYEENLKMDFKSKEDEGGIQLKTKDNINFQGVFTYEDDGRSVTGKVQGILYENDDGCLLVGKWVEEGYDYTWIVELKKANKISNDKK